MRGAGGGGGGGKGRATKDLVVGPLVEELFLRFSHSLFYSDYSKLDIQYVVKRLTEIYKTVLQNRSEMVLSICE